MKMALRSMSPQVIAVDEIGTKFDADAIWEMTCCGVNVFCTAHGETIESLIKRNELNELFNKKVFERFIFLQNKEGITGEIKSVLNDKLENIWKEDG
ncbi:hypothetical protein SDC9_205528 [bioreactor metagenome]|uniref:Stage III sporulation protein AA AAA+ ATPase domain-containing protein n=1 Tax=bioreactor metagenome TaxID=1076179 RepID=A0A645JBS5_9ZZZZ